MCICISSQFLFKIALAQYTNYQLDRYVYFFVFAPQITIKKRRITKKRKIYTAHRNRLYNKQNFKKQHQSKNAKNVVNTTACSINKLRTFLVEACCRRCFCCFFLNSLLLVYLLIALVRMLSCWAHSVA